MRVALWGNPSAAKWWRLGDPAKYLQRHRIEAQLIEQHGITEDIAEWADLYVLNGVVDKAGIALLHGHQLEYGKKLVVDCDDFLHVADDSPFKIEHEITDAPEVVKISMDIADLVTTTNEYLADNLRTYAKRVDVLPNYMDLERWERPKLKNTSDTIRIGWAGSMTHLEDLKLVVEPLKRICAEFPQVRLVFVGDARIAHYLDGCPVEIVPGVPFEVWPDRLQGLRLDIGLAPLVDNEFNRCKSNIKWQEYSIAQVAGVYSYTVYHSRSFEPQYGLVARTPDQWYQCIRNLIVSPELRGDIAKNAYGQVKRYYSLEKNIKKWVQAYESLFK